MRFMRQQRRLLRLGALGLLAFLALSSLAGALLAEGALHPHRKALSAEDELHARDLARAAGAHLADVAITAVDGVTLRAWTLRPQDGNGNAVILLHGHTDNRMGRSASRRAGGRCRGAAQPRRLPPEVRPRHRLVSSRLRHSERLTASGVMCRGPGTARCPPEV